MICLIQVADTRGNPAAFDRPFLVPGVPLILPNASSNLWINPAAFVRQATGFGNAGRNILVGPGFADVDLAIVPAIAKDTRTTCWDLGSSRQIQFAMKLLF